MGSPQTPLWTIVGRLIGLTAQVLQPEQLDEARRLLYEVYFEELGWDPPGPNASQLRADHDRRLLIDAFDDTAIWLGVYSGGALIATMRLLERGERPLEIEGHISLSRSLQTDTIEANRVAIRAAHRRGPALPLLHTLAGSVGRRLGARRSVGTTSASIAFGSAARYGFKTTGQTFRYHSTDPEEVCVVTYDLSLQHQLSVIRSILQARLTPSRALRGGQL